MRKDKKPNLDIDNLDLPANDVMWAKIIMASINANQYKDTPRDRLARCVIISLSLCLCVLLMCFTYFICNYTIELSLGGQTNSVGDVSGNENNVAQDGGSIVDEY